MVKCELRREAELFPVELTHASVGWTWELIALLCPQFSHLQSGDGHTCLQGCSEDEGQGVCSTEANSVLSEG